MQIWNKVFLFCFFCPDNGHWPTTSRLDTFFVSVFVVRVCACVYVYVCIVHVCTHIFRPVQLRVWGKRHWLTFILVLIAVLAVAVWTRKKERKKVNSARRNLKTRKKEKNVTFAAGQLTVLHGLWQFTDPPADRAAVFRFTAALFSSAVTHEIKQEKAEMRRRGRGTNHLLSPQTSHFLLLRSNVFHLRVFISEWF